MMSDTFVKRLELKKVQNSLSFSFCVCGCTPVQALHASTCSLVKSQLIMELTDADQQYFPVSEPHSHFTHPKHIQIVDLAHDYVPSHMCKHTKPK